MFCISFKAIANRRFPKKVCKALRNKGSRCIQSTKSLRSEFEWSENQGQSKKYQHGIGIMFALADHEMS